MPAAAWVTLIIAALIIAITAVGLLRVIFHLRAIRATLVATTGGVQAVAQLTSTVTLFVAVCVLLSGLLADLAYAALDPRVRI